MPYFTASELRARGNEAALRKSRTVDAFLKEEARLFDTDTAKYDVFLSHSIKDKAIILGIRSILVANGLTVYVDWIEDPALDRSNVTPATAEKLRKRMRQSKSLIYAHSKNSPSSKWMPWELGFFDGYNGNIAILPIVDTSTDSFKGQEFLGLYPYIDKYNDTLWINKGDAPLTSIGQTSTGNSHRMLKEWMRDKVGVFSR